MKCPECGETVELSDDMVVGEIIECVNCGVELEIASIDPVVFNIFEEEEK